MKYIKTYLQVLAAFDPDGRIVPVMFYWTNYQGQSMPEDNRAVTGRWWKDPGDSIRNHYGASITFSEMRHVQKMMRLEQDGEQMNFAKIMGLQV